MMHSFHHSLSPRRAGAFTLVELMVVMVVLTLILLLLTQLTNNTALSIGTGTRQVEVDGQARLVLDRVAFDVAGMLQRTDIDYTFNRQAGDDFLSFYAEALSGKTPAGATTPRMATLLGLRVNAVAGSANFGRLERGAVDLSASGVNFAPLRNNAFTPLFQTPNSLPTLADGDYRVLGDQVFRFEFCFLCNDPASGKVALHAALPSNATLADLKALVIAIAVLDAQGRANVTAGQLKTLHDGLPDYVDTVNTQTGFARDIAAVWTDAVNSVSYGAGMPPNIRGAVRIYQRYYYLR